MTQFVFVFSENLLRFRGIVADKLENLAQKTILCIHISNGFSSIRKWFYSHFAPQHAFVKNNLLISADTTNAQREGEQKRKINIEIRDNVKN